MTKQFLIPLLLLGFMTACSENHFKQSKTFAGGKKVSAETLNLGKTTYMEYCVSCHGDKGDGKGFAATGSTPIPRDFTLGIYKFGNVSAGELPHDEDFYRIIRHGLKGTAMLPWDISDKRLDAVTQYIKTFAPKVWEAKGAKLGEHIKPTKDPYKLAHKEFAIQKGKEVYHVVAQCTTCHRGYVSKSELAQMNKKLKSDVEWDDTINELKLQGTEYGPGVLPPDFTWHEVRSANSVEELYVRIAAGVGGTSMPAWRGTIEDNEIWAVAYYVKHLMEMKDKPAREALMESIK